MVILLIGSTQGSPGISSSYWELVTAWASIRTLHLWLRYRTLAVLRFNTVHISHHHHNVFCVAISLEMTTFSRSLNSYFQMW